MPLKKNNFISFKKKKQCKNKTKKVLKYTSYIVNSKIIDMRGKRKKNYSNENTFTSLSVLHLYIAFNVYSFLDWLKFCVKMWNKN